MNERTPRNLGAFLRDGVRDPRAWLVGVYAVMWLGGVVTYSVNGSPPADMRWAGGAFLALAAVLVLSTTPVRHLAPLLFAALIGFASEVIGVKTGTIYSGYRYTEALGVHVWDVPVAMPAAWLVLAAYVLEVSRRWRLPGVVSVPLAAAWLTGIDLLIDPVAANPLGFWKWETPGAYYGIPAHNFAGWFGVSLVIFIVARWWTFENPWARWLGLSLIGFFVVIAFAFRLVIPGLIGVALIGLDVLVCRIALPVKPEGRDSALTSFDSSVSG